MAERSTIARPYAQAIFQLAEASGDFSRWSEALQVLSLAARDPNLRPLLNSPRISRQQLADLLIEVAGERLDQLGRNFVRVLAEGRRLALLPDIAALYEELRARAEGTIDARLITAQPVDATACEKIAAALSKRLNRKVNLTTETDPSLLGGAVVRAGDLVIDGSVRGRLERMAATLNR
ncbi:MAG: F0F1 ATP synthase subunit delta [Xanthomonadaceae bacterium]|nr:F0F1 ATP synthase subunit delta [Xanthomonadaceae bacterium]